jgi:hypothetical protein
LYSFSLIFTLETSIKGKWNQNNPRLIFISFIYRIFKYLRWLTNLVINYNYANKTPTFILYIYLAPTLFILKNLYFWNKIYPPSSKLDEAISHPLWLDHCSENYGVFAIDITWQLAIIYRHMLCLGFWLLFSLQAKLSFFFKSKIIL